ncbi:hypothetical protein Acr_00g0055360 [Actinidia rufa]|uniref:Uncharacterized protein n=1 Tax=Actinidia rufa TaxID=165716 RepID=A0A7J0DM53_9ERIC|nr:hypothetical protein Acr_00g0055360 [Actinidia rufa]
MRKLRERPSPGVSSVSFNRRLSKYCAICSKQSLLFCLENPTMVSLDYTRSAKSVITVAMIAVQFILIGPQSMRMRAVKMKPMPMKFLVVGVIKEVVVRGVVAKGIMIKEVNHRKVVLGPLKESSVPKVPKDERKSSVLLVHNEDEFDKEARESKQIFAMVLT